ncbi:MAG: hypothetical protein ACRDYE_10220 [Acidimicrobiales bacterium]
MSVPSIPVPDERPPPERPVPDERPNPAERPLPGGSPLSAEPAHPAEAPPSPTGTATQAATGADEALAVADDGPATGTGLVADDEETFTTAVSAKLESYVYLLVDPRTGRPFHVGRGRDDRCFEHVRAAREGRGVETAREGRGDRGAALDNDPVLDRIRQVEASGRPVRVEILRYGLDPDEASTIEAVAHDLLGLPGVPDGGSQRRPAGEVRALLTKRAKFKRPHQVVLLRVGPVGTDASYWRARHGWRIGRRWVDVEAPRSPHWAAVVVGELVDSVYRLDGWEAASPVPDRPTPRGTGARAPEQYSFVGTRDPELERRYVGKSVAPYLGRVSQGSVSYVWCGPHWVNTAQ